MLIHFSTVVFDDLKAESTEERQWIKCGGAKPFRVLQTTEGL